MTFLYYLSDVEEGGETTFPLADMNIEKWDTNDRATVPAGWNKITNSQDDRWNLTYRENCHRSGVYVKPKKGMALLFYNHLNAHCYKDQQWGCELGDIDRYSVFGFTTPRFDNPWLYTIFCSCCTA
eukprot:SAG31_NODE_26458_length_442_cov_0.583090_1_plen_125_part_10